MLRELRCLTPGDMPLGWPCAQGMSFLNAEEGRHITSGFTSLFIQSTGTANADHEPHRMPGSQLSRLRLSALA